MKPGKKAGSDGTILSCARENLLTRAPAGLHFCGMPWKAGLRPLLTALAEPPRLSRSIPLRLAPLYSAPAQSVTLFVIPPRPNSDFNADRKADLLFRHPSSGNVVLWLMN